MILKWINNYFNISNNQSSIKTEVYSAFISFFSMIYIAFINPIILQPTGLNPVAVFVSTCIAIALASFIMGFYAKLPYALAPGMGLNALFTYTIVLTLGYTPYQAFALIFISGCTILAISTFAKQNVLKNIVPESLKHAITAGIGMFIIIIALKNSGIIVGHPATLVALGNLTSFTSVAIILAFLLVAYGFIKNNFYIPLLSLVGLSLVAYFFVPSAMANFNNVGLSNNNFMGLNFNGLLNISLVGVLLTIVLSSFFDSIGMLYSYSYLVGKKDVNFKRALQSLGLADIIAALLGTSSFAMLLENNNGVKAGGRTGLVAVVIGILFLVTLLAAPLVKYIPTWVATPLLVLLGVSMLTNLQHLNFKDPSEYIPAFFVLFFIPFTYSIATGIALGFVSYTFLKLISKQFKSLNLITIILTLLFISSLVMR